jgi:hypothetical protein
VRPTANSEWEWLSPPTQGRRTMTLISRDRIEQIERKIQETQNMPEESKLDLLDALAILKEEAAELARTRPEDAQSIAQFAEASTHEAIRTERKPELLERALGGLSASVAEFEASHPKLAEAAHQMALILSNMGI